MNRKTPVWRERCSLEDESLESSPAAARGQRTVPQRDRGGPPCGLRGKAPFVHRSLLKEAGENSRSYMHSVSV